MHKKCGLVKKTDNLTQAAKIIVVLSLAVFGNRWLMVELGMLVLENGKYRDPS